jgi:hypothetical protein
MATNAGRIAGRLRLGFTKRQVMRVPTSWDRCQISRQNSNAIRSKLPGQPKADLKAWQRCGEAFVGATV